MKLFRIRKHAIVSLMFLGTIMLLLASVGNVHATTVTLIKGHHPPSTFKDPSGTVDGYYSGQTILWTITINVTTSTAPFSWLSIEDLSIVDSLPNTLGGGPLYTTYVAGSQASSSANGAAAFTDFGNGTLLWNFGHGPFTTGVLSPPPFQDPTQFYIASIVFNSTINGNVPDGTFLTNTGVAHYTETASQVHSNPSISDVIWIPRPVLNIVKTNPAKVENGSSFNYTLQLSNTGHEDATGVVVQDIMPTGVTHTPPATATSGSFITDTSTNVTWTGTLFNVTNPGNTVNITIPVTANTLLSSVFNSAGFIAYPSDAVFTNKNANCTTGIIHPAISLTKTPSSSKIESGSSVTYNYTVTNTGDATLTGVSVTDDHLGTITSSQTLTSGQSLSFTKTTTLTANATNTATATGVDQNGVSANATATSFVQVIHPAITLTKTPSASKVASGSTVSYTYVVTNTGDTSLTVGLTDSVFGTIFTGKVLAAGASNTTIIGEVISANTTNLATATGVDQTGASVNATATSSVQVIHAGITLTKTPSAAKVENGSSVTYTFTVTNTGDTSLTVGLTDTSFGTIFTGMVMAPGASNVTTISRILTANTTNVATATGVVQTGTSVNANATAFVQVIHAGITLTKTPSAAKVENGSSVTYTFTVTNTGDTSLTVGLTDSVFGTIFSGKVLTAGASNVTTISRILTANTTNVATATGVDQTGASVNANATASVQIIHRAITLTKNPSATKVENGSSVTYTFTVTNTGDTSLTVRLTDTVFGTIFTGMVMAPGASNVTTISRILTANTTNVATATGVDQTGASVNANATASVQVIHPAITLTKNPNAKVDSGTTVNYTYIVTNTGDTSLTVDLTDTTFGTIFTGMVMAPGASNTTVISEVLTANTTNTATAVGVDQTGASVQATATATVRVIHAAISLTKTADPSTPQIAPANFTYTYVVTNTGDVALTGVTVYDQTFNTLILGPITLSVGQSVNGTYGPVIFPNATVLTNYANATGTEQTGAVVQAFAQATITVLTPPTGGSLQPINKMMFLFATIEDMLASYYWVAVLTVGAIAALIVFRKRRK